MRQLSKSVVLLFLSALCCFGETADRYVSRIASLIDPAKLSTLGPRGANPRVQKYVYWLESARRDKVDPAIVIDAALKSLRVGTNQTALTREAMLRNLSIAEKLGCLDAAGMLDMRHGKSPTIRRGPYTGDEASVDHVIPRAIVPELDNIIANLELMPLRMNESKNAKITQRQYELAKKFREAGLLSEKGYEAVLNHYVR